MWKTREVCVGNVGVGGKNRVRIQSMTTSNTRDVAATADQIMQLADHGCEIARVTVQGMKEADACEGIKSTLIKKGYEIPLVADIHFYPPAAMRVVDFCDKVRINPGNFVDRRASFKVLEYDDATYAAELMKIEEKFTPLVEKCKRLKRAMRIGTNHGSLSDRIMNRYGDTPYGMVESALEFTRVARKLDYHDLIYSMKASNTQVMIEAYRLLVAEMMKLGWDYPLHLGVTEAGEGEDGRVKSAIGIGALLLDGIGDTIRVSLTEDPWYEIDPCKRLMKLKGNFTRLYMGGAKREVRLPKGLHRDGSVILPLSREEIESESFFADLGCQVELGRVVVTPKSVDGVITDEEHPKLEKLKQAGLMVISDPYVVSEDWEQVLHDRPDVIYLEIKSVDQGRAFFAWMREHTLDIPVVLRCADKGDLMIAAAEYGSLLCDQMGEGISLVGQMPLAERRSLAFAILQGARMRSSKTEFISCPSCGRTLFDLQTVAARIRLRTDHLPGVKIAIMGCIVNGPGEMADADFGYVGSRPGKIDLYVGKTCVERNIDMEEADERLVELIKAHGRWVEPDDTGENNGRTEEGEGDRDRAELPDVSRSST